MQALLNKEGFDDDIDYYIKEPTVNHSVNDDGDDVRVNVYCILPEEDQINETFEELCKSFKNMPSDGSILLAAAESDLGSARKPEVKAAEDEFRPLWRHAQKSEQLLDETNAKASLAHYFYNMMIHKTIEYLAMYQKPKQGGICSRGAATVPNLRASRCAGAHTSSHSER